MFQIMIFITYSQEVDSLTGYKPDQHRLTIRVVPLPPPIT